MWRLSILPAPDSGLRALRRRRAGRRRGQTSPTSPAPSAGTWAATTASRPCWPRRRTVGRGRPASDSTPAACGTATVVTVTTVGADWLDRPATPPHARWPPCASSPARTPAPRSPSRASPSPSAAPRACTVRLSDPLVSRSHARILLGANPVVTDEGSAHGTVVGGSPGASRRERPVGRADHRRGDRPWCSSTGAGATRLRGLHRPAAAARGGPRRRPSSSCPHRPRRPAPGRCRGRCSSCRWSSAWACSRRRAAVTP